MANNLFHYDSPNGLEIEEEEDTGVVWFNVDDSYTPVRPEEMDELARKWLNSRRYQVVGPYPVEPQE